MHTSFEEYPITIQLEMHREHYVDFFVGQELWNAASTLALAMVLGVVMVCTLFVLLVLGWMLYAQRYGIYRFVVRLVTGRRI